jgi:hypothetical protein
VAERLSALDLLDVSAVQRGEVFEIELDGEVAIDESPRPQRVPSARPAARAA